MNATQIQIRVTEDGIISAEVEGCPVNFGDIVEVTIGKVVMRSEKPEGQTCNVVKIVAREVNGAGYKSVQAAPQLKIREFVCPISAARTEDAPTTPVMFDMDAATALSKTIENIPAGDAATMTVGNLTE